MRERERERGRERERKERERGERNINIRETYRLVAGIKPVTQVCALDGELILRPFSGWASTLTTEKRSQG